MLDFGIPNLITGLGGEIKLEKLYKLTPKKGDV